MKKIIGTFLLLLLFVTLISADAQSFSSIVFNNLPGFTYDKTTTAWGYIRTYTKRFLNADVNVMLMQSGIAKVLDGPPWITIQIVDNNSKPLSMATDITLMVDGKWYTFANLIPDSDEGTAALILGNVGKSLMEDIASAKNVSVTIYMYSDNFSFSIPEYELAGSFKVFAENILKNNVFSYVDETILLQCDEYFDAHAYDSIFSN